MIDENMESEAIRFVLGEMTEDEESAYARQLEQSPELKDLVREISCLFGTVAEDSTSGQISSPPAAIRESLLNYINKDQTNRSKGMTRGSLVSLGLLLVLSCLAMLAAAYLWVENRDLKTKISEQSLALFKSENLRLEKLTSDSEYNHEVLILWNTLEQSGVIKPIVLPANSPDQDYQLWIIDRENATPVNGGVFHLSSHKSELSEIQFSAQNEIHDAIAFAISVEKKGGVTVREGPIVAQQGL